MVRGKQVISYDNTEIFALQLKKLAGVINTILTIHQTMTFLQRMLFSSENSNSQSIHSDHMLPFLEILVSYFSSTAKAVMVVTVSNDVSVIGFAVRCT